MQRGEKSLSSAEVVDWRVSLASPICSASMVHFGGLFLCSSPAGTTSIIRQKSCGCFVPEPSNPMMNPPPIHPLHFPPVSSLRLASFCSVPEVLALQDDDGEG